MNKLTLRSFLAAAVLVTAASLHAKDAGAVDFGALVPAKGREYVEVNLKPGILNFAATIVAMDEPEAAELLRNIRGVRVHVAGLDDTNREANLAHLNRIRADLVAAGWEQVVTVRAAKDEGDDDVAIFVKTSSDDAIDGLVVTVLSHDGEAVLVNVVGNIRADQIAAIAEKLNIRPLRELKLNAAAPAEAA
ncbi:MAG: DUF4252 domain-containing protein [Cephaloticoccus sp.]